MPQFTDNQRRILAHYVTNTDSNVFCVRGEFLQGLLGAAGARYSRAKGGFRTTLYNEFISPPQKRGRLRTWFEEQRQRWILWRVSRLLAKRSLNFERAQGMIARVLLAYGDDSVGELEGAWLSLEGVSVLLAKVAEECRIGGSPIEQSTRYVLLDEPDEHGRFRYAECPAIAADPGLSKYYRSHMDDIFRVYRDLIPKMEEYYRRRKPMHAAAYDVADQGRPMRLIELTDAKQIKAFHTTYANDIKTRTCDTLRSLLPLAVTTNVGIFGNGRYFENMLRHMYSSGLPEAREMGPRAHAELGKVIPQYVARAAADQYRISRDAAMRKLAGELFSRVNMDHADGVDLLDRGAAWMSERMFKEADFLPRAIERLQQEESDNVLTSVMLYPYTTLPLRQIRDIVRMLPAAKKAEIRATYLGDRPQRRNKPGRAFECGYEWLFDFVCDAGSLKDLQRHRANTHAWQLLTPLLGFLMPDDIVDAGFADEARRAVELSYELYYALRNDHPESAQYATLHGSKVRWFLGANDRALCQMIELRTGRQGHPLYRKLCQDMHRLVAQRAPWRAEAMCFTDLNDYEWPRAESEARQRRRESALDD